MTIDQNILNEVINLQAHFRSGYDRATILRKRLEGKTPPAPQKGLNEDQRAKLSIGLQKSVTRKKMA
mgnify:CR=1 FL=1